MVVFGFSAGEAVLVMENAGCVWHLYQFHCCCFVLASISTLTGVDIPWRLASDNCVLPVG